MGTFAPHPRLLPSTACVLVVDVQERLVPAIPPEAVERVVKYAGALIGAARELGIPVLAVEQYPRGLGPLVARLRQMLPEPPIAKTCFSAGAEPVFLARLAAARREQVVVAGMETHVCVFQTVRDLTAQGYEVHVCADAVASRTEEHRQVGLDLCRVAGAIVTTAETAIFDLLHEAATPVFRRVAPLVK